MSRENRVMWFGSIFGALIFFLFSAIGINQFYKNIDIKSDKGEASRENGKR